MVSGKTRNTRQFRPACVKRPLFRPSDVEFEKDYVSRKYVGILNFNQLITLLNEVDFDDTSDTMGSLTEYGWLNSISFEKSEQSYWTDTDGYINAYISPMYDDDFEVSNREKLYLVQDHLDKVDNWLKKDAIDQAWEIKQGKIEKPSFLDEVYFDFDQMIIPNFIQS